MKGMYQNVSKENSINPFEGWDVRNVTDRFAYTREFNQTLGKMNTRNVAAQFRSMSGYTEECDYNGGGDDQNNNNNNNKFQTSICKYILQICNFNHKHLAFFLI
jgi:hypothetical protein